MRSQGKDRVLSLSHQPQNQPSTSLRTIQRGYRSQVSGSGQPEMILVMLRQSKHRRSFSHFSTGSPGAYLMDSCRDTSCNVRAAGIAQDISADSHSQPGIPQHPTALKGSHIRKLPVANFHPLKAFHLKPVREKQRSSSLSPHNPFPTAAKHTDVWDSHGSWLTAAPDVLYLR